MIFQQESRMLHHKSIYTVLAVSALSLGWVLIAADSVPKKTSAPAPKKTSAPEAKKAAVAETKQPEPAPAKKEKPWIWQDHFAFVKEKGSIREFTLKSNDLQVLLMRNPVAPVATVCVVYKVGSRNEGVGYTGSTHLLEHMMFKGTPRHNKDNPPKPLGTQIAATLSAMGADFNATTSNDRTNYFEKVPSDKVGLALDIEADRMRNSFIADKDRTTEMVVVRNELERGENSPARVLNLHLMALAYREHPYHHPTIGWRSDVEGVPTSRLKAFYDQYYHPNNSALIVVGDFDETELLATIDAKFGPLTRSPRPIPPMYTTEPPQQGERRMVLKRPGRVGLVYMDWHIGRGTDPETYPLVVLGNILTQGVNSRLQKALVDSGKAVNVDSGPYQLHDPGIFTVTMTLAPNVAHAEGEKIARSELTRLIRDGVTPAELEAAKNQIYSSTIFDRDDGFAVARNISEAVAIGDWTFYTDYLDTINQVTTDDVRKMAEKYLTDDNLSVGWFVPPTPAGAAAPPPGKKSKLWSFAPPDLAFYREPGVKEAAKRPAPAMARKAVIPAPDPAKLFVNRTVRSVGPNGEILLALENHANATITLQGRLKAGPTLQPQNWVLPSLAANLLLKGTTLRSKEKLGEDLEGRGIELNYFADRLNPDQILISGRCLSRDWTVLQSALLETLKQPVFPESEIALAKKEMEAAYQQEADNTGRQASIAALRKVYPAGHPLRPFSTDEKLKMLQAVSRADLQAFHARVYGGDSLILAVVGDLNGRQTLDGLAKALYGWKARALAAPQLAIPAVSPTLTDEVTVKIDKANVDVLAAGYTGISRAAPDEIAADLANNVLGGSTLSSRLGLRVRDELGMTYGIFSRFTAGSIPGHWLMGMSVAPENREKALAAAHEVLNTFLKDGLSPKELADAKTEYIGGYKVGLATNGGIANELVEAEYYGFGIRYLDEYPGKVDSVTLEDVNRAARKYIDADHLVTAAAGKVGAAEAK
jgi:zinc protease